jgi:hypothetical protein
MNPDKGDKTFHYLQYESCEIEQGGRKWKVYGSPVGLNVLDPVYPANPSARVGKSLVWRCVVYRKKAYSSSFSLTGWAFNYKGGEEAEGL